jgi:SAM-dependent methyltransferase
MAKEDLVAKKVNAFYDKTPFPDYDLRRFNSPGDLMVAASPFAQYLNRLIPQNASIIDAGCGTGQLCAYLSLTHDDVWGIDFTKSSLDKAAKLKEKLKLDNLHLEMGDILNLNIKRQFDVVFCNDVLHHTGNPYRGFQNLCNITKPGGHLVIGLYNRFGRLLLKLRRILLRTIFRNNERIKNYFIERHISHFKDKERARSWWNDQHEHPHESTHTVAEVMGWFRKNDIEFINCLPSLRLFDTFSIEFQNLFRKDTSVKTWKPFWLPQIKWVLTTDREGGHFLMVGRKR